MTSARVVVFYNISNSSRDVPPFIPSDDLKAVYYFGLPHWSPETTESWADAIFEDMSGLDYRPVPLRPMRIGDALRFEPSSEPAFLMLRESQGWLKGTEIPRLREP